MNIEEAINKIKEVIYMSDGEKVDYIDINHSDLGGEVSVDIFIKAIETLLTAYEKEKEKNKKIEIIVNKLMPLAECSYWNYENHTCTHTCRGCDYLNEDNKRTSSGILIDKDRYCRLYEDGNAEKDTKFVDVEDLIKRHLKEE